MVNQAISKKLKRARTRMLLMETAKSVFSEQGFDKVQTGDIARAAGVSVGLFYKHFQNKDDIFLEIVIEANKAFRERLEMFWDDLNQGESLEELIRQAVSVVFDLFETHPFCASILAMGEHSGIPVLNSARTILTAEIDQALKAFHHSLVRDRKMKDLNADIVINALFGIFSGVASLYLKGTSTREETIETITEMIAWGVLVERK